MLRKKLAAVDRGLGLLLIGPPAPNTPEQRAKWIDEPPACTPILEQWDPPTRIPRKADGGVALSQTVTCYQRGHHPQSVKDQYVAIYADRFHHGIEPSVRSIEGLAYDFLIVAQSSTVAAGCIVEFRCSMDGSQPPYLYISSLCTHRAHGGRRLAHQIVHSVHTLGALMLEQNRSGNATWRNAIVGTDLFIGLTVRKTIGSNKESRLMELYTGCGMVTRQMDPSIPRINYSSFTGHSIYDWRLDASDALIPMWKQVKPGVLYSNEGDILASSEEGEPMYYEFPSEDLALVTRTGIVHRRHAYLHPAGEAHVADTEDIVFTKQMPAPGKGAFCIRTKRVKADVLLLKISIPAYFSSCICTRETLSLQYTAQ